MRMKFGTRLIGGFLLIVLLIIALTLYSLFVSRRTLRDAVGAHTVALAKAMLQRVESNLQRKLDEVERYTLTAELRTALAESNREFERMENAEATIAERDRQWFEAPSAEVTPFMESLIYRPAAEHMRAAFFEHYLKKYGHRVYVEVFAANRYGALAAATGKTSDYMQADELWWTEAREKGSHISDVEFDESAGEYAVSLTARVEDEDGAFMGAVKALVVVSEIMREVEAAGVRDRSTNVRLITANGRLIYSTGDFTLLQDIRNEPWFEQLKLRLDEERNEFFVAAENSHAHLYAYATTEEIGAAQNRRWILLVGRDLNKVLEPAFLLRKRILAASILLIGLALIIAFGVSRNVTGAVAELMRGAVAIGRGDLNYRVKVERQDELGDLAETFNTMAAQRQEAQTRLEASEARLRMLFEGIDDTLIVHDEEGRILDCNEAACRRLGYSREELLSMTTRDIDAPEFAGGFEKRLERQSESGHFACEGVHMTKDGRRIPVDINTAVIDYRGRKAVLGISRDITARKKAEQEVRESEQRLRSLFEGIEDTLLVHDEEGRILDCNRAACERLGYTREELLSMTTRDIDAPEFAEGFAERLNRQKAEGHIACEGVHVTRDGRRIPVDINTRVIEFHGRKAVLGISRDITERKRAEAQLQAKTRDLETLLYVTSHDLREPLRAIENFSRMVETRYADKLDDKGRDFLTRVVRGAKRLDKLLDDILALSRAQRMERPSEKIPGREIVEEALIRLENRIERTGARVTVAENLPALRVNRTWATQAIYNLVANALKFTRDGQPPEVEIAPWSESGEGEVGIVVRDRGPGVDPRHAERIFQLFQRTVGREVEGTGAGLAIVRQIAESHGGKVWVRPREGGGSEFVITFAHADEEAAPAQSQGSLT